MKPYLVATLAAVGLATCACSGGSSPAAQQTHTVIVTAPASTPATSATTQPAAGASSAASSSGAAAPAGCLSRYLNGSIGLTQGTAGAVEIAIVFKNLDNVPCTLTGFPRRGQGSGHAGDRHRAAVHGEPLNRSRADHAPGGYANATLQIVDARNYRRRCASR